MSLGLLPYDEMKAHAKREAPKEACGLVLVVKGKYRYFPCRNIHSSPEHFFYLSPEDYVEASQIGEAVVVFHSHPSTQAIASLEDKEQQAEGDMQWLIYSLVDDAWCVCEGNVKSALYGREYRHGVLDCYSFLKDFYEEELGILLPNVYREDCWWDKGENMYVDNYPKNGFRNIVMSELKYGDVIIMQINSPVPNHGAIYVGNNMIGHHLTKRLSSKDVYGATLRDRSVLFLRHKDND